MPHYQNPLMNLKNIPLTSRGQKMHICHAQLIEADILMNQIFPNPD